MHWEMSGGAHHFGDVQLQKISRAYARSQYNIFGLLKCNFRFEKLEAEFECVEAWQC